MRLIHIEGDGAFTLVERLGSEIPPYAILSHTWGPDRDEVTYSDMTNGTSRTKVGFDKLQFCGKQTVEHHLEYFWNDTCCIDKSSSAELTEAINSMFRWYKNAEVCLVYLTDVTSKEDVQELKQSRWFTRGWTLQELIAPTSVEFFTKNGVCIGDKQGLQAVLHEITGIALSVFEPTASLSAYNVDERMSWASGRQTKREEDEAYCLLGIFDVHMPLIYGEGRDNAMLRLQREIGVRHRESLPIPTQPPYVGSSSPEPDLRSEHNSFLAQKVDTRSNATLAPQQLAEQLFDLAVQQREHVADALQSASERPRTNFQRSIMHTTTFEHWCLVGGILGCCTEDVEDETSARSTAAAVAQYLSTSLRNGSSRDVCVLYIGAADQTDFAGIAVHERSERFWAEKFLIQALSLHASTAMALQSVLDGVETEQLRALSYMATQAAFLDNEAICKLIAYLVEIFIGHVIISVENVHEDIDTISSVLRIFVDQFNIHLFVVSDSEVIKERIFYLLHKDTEYNECLESISFEGQDTRRSQIAQSLQDTNAWIWQHPSYMAWESDRSSILWIEGKAGSGKSVLTKSTQQRLSSNSRTFTCDWYFSTRGGRTLMSHASLLRAVIHQILQKDSRTFLHVCDIYRRYRSGLAEKLWESLSAMQDILQIILTAGFKVRIVIDAMDEAGSSEDGSHSRRDLLAFLRELVTSASTVSLKIIVSSRPLFDMEMDIWRYHEESGNVHRIVLQEENYDTICIIVDHGIEAIRKSIRSWKEDTEKSPNASKRPIARRSGHTSGRPSRRRNLNQFYDKQDERDEAMLTRIKQYLLENAKGVVLWVISVLNILEATVRKTIYTFAELESKLKSIPVELSGLYEYYIEDLKERFDSDELLRVHRVLMFISGANAIKPLTLEELWDALATPSCVKNSLTSELDPIEQGRIHIKAWQDFWWSLHDMCGPLVEVVSVRTENVCSAYGNDEIDAKDNVQLSHRTVKDFLARPELAGVLAFSDEEAETFVQGTLHNYAAVVMPAKPTPYTVPGRLENNDWPRAVEDMAEYLDDKRLLPWVFNTISDNLNSRRKICGIYGARIQNAFNHHLVSSFGPAQLNEPRAILQQTEGNVNAHYIEYACSNGLIVATRIFLEILSFGVNGHLVYGVLDAALLVAIRYEMVDLVKLLTSSTTPGVQSKEPDYRFWIQDRHDILGTPQYLTPFEIAAAQTGNEIIAALVYDRNHRVEKSMPWHLWPFLSKGRNYWCRSARDYETYREYTRKMKSGREQEDALPTDDIRACIMLILEFTSRWGYL